MHIAYIYIYIDRVIEFTINGILASLSLYTVNKIEWEYSVILMEY